METCVVYLRKSTDREGKQESSLAKQQAWIEWELEKNSHLSFVSLEGAICEIPHDAFIYESASAKEYSKPRPMFQKMLQLIRERGVDWVMVYHPDRISRNNADMADFMELFDASKEQKKTGGFIKKGVITNRGTFLADEPSRVQEFENRLNQAKRDNAERAMETRQTQDYMKKKLGLYPHEFPFWYLPTRIRKWTITQDSERAALVRMAFKMRLEWCGFTEIAKEFGKKGFKKNAKSIARILSNPLYYGEFEYEGIMYPVKNEGWNAIVPKHEFDAVAKYNAENPRKHAKSNPILSKRVERPFDRLVFNLDGQFLQGYSSTKTNGVYYKQPKGASYKIHISETKLYETAAEQITRFELPPQFKALIEIRLRFWLRESFKQEEIKIKSLEGQIKKCDERIEGYLDKIATEDDAEFYDDFKRKVRGERERRTTLEKELENLLKGSKDIDAMTKQYSEYFEDLPKTFGQVSKKEKADILRGLGVAFVIGIDKNVSVNADEFEELFIP